MHGLPDVVSFRTEGLSEEAAKLLARAGNKSELVKYLLERYAREKMKGGEGDGRADNRTGQR